MGAACCRCQQVAFEDDMLRFSSLNSSQLAVAVATSAAATTSSRGNLRARASSRSRSRLPSRQSVTMNHSLANYVSFPFPFASKAVMKTPERATKRKVGSASNRNSTRSGFKTRDKARLQQQLQEILPHGLGDHFRKNQNGLMTPLSLMELSVRRVCASLVADPAGDMPGNPNHHPSDIPSEVAGALLGYLKRHEALTKDHFRLLARYLFHEWDLCGQLEVDDSWFDDVALAALYHIKSINLKSCPNLTSLGSDRWFQVDELPNLTSASFEDCVRLNKSVPDLLQSSTRLTSLNLSGCRNIDDRSLLALRRLFRLRNLNISGCNQVTDEGFKCLTGLSRIVKLIVSRCTKLTDAAFEDAELAFPNLRHLDVSYTRITDVALAHLSHATTMTTLIIRGCSQVGDLGVERLSSLVSLEHFDARHCGDVRSPRAEWIKLRVLLFARTAFGEAEAAVLKDTSVLEELDLRASRILKRGFEMVSKLTNLKRLNLAETALTDDALIQICRGASGLLELDLSHTEITDAGTEGLTYLDMLETLRMDTSGITNRALSNVSRLTNLKRLHLFGTSIGDNGILHLTKLTNLSELEVCGGAISDRGVELISRIKSLRSLNLSQNRSINAKSLLSLRALTDLEHLNLSNTGISAVSLRHLYALKKLESLSVYGCELSSTQVEMLQELLPSLRCLRCS